MRINTTDPLKAHSDLGAAGWQLETLPAQHPRHAIGLYSRQDLVMYLIQKRDHFSLEAAPTSILDSRLPHPADYAALPEAAELQALTRERNTCADARVTEIDDRILAILITHWEA